LPHPIGPRGAENLKFTIYVPLVPKMHHTKFEKNWSSGYQEDMMFALPWGQNCYPEDYKFYNFGRGLLALHHHVFSFSST
jgi:hypothetical protein